MSIIQGTSKTSAAGGYTIDQSIRFNDDDSAYLSRAMGTGGDTKTGTISLWVKRANLGTQQLFFGQVVSSRNSDIRFKSDDTIQFYLQETAGAGYALVKTSSNVYRDVGSWYHIYATWDTTQSSPEWNLYVNGVQPTWATDSNNGMSQNANIAFFGNSDMVFGRQPTAGLYPTDAYLAEINCIEGSVVAISEFAETNADTGQWVPKKYTGSYPGKSFYITGADSADLGADDSGNGNDFTSSGLAAADQVSDSPTDNYGVMNPLDNGRPSNITLSDGNLTAAFSGAGYQGGIRSSIFFDSEDSDGWYAECTLDSLAFASIFRAGVANASLDLSTTDAQSSADGWAYSDQGAKLNNSYTTGYGSSVGVGDVVGIAVRNGKIYFAVNNTWQGSADPVTESNPAFSNLIGDVAFCQSTSTGGSYAHTATWNFGQTGFTYTPPTGYKSLRVQDLPDPTIADPSAYFQTTLYTGNASTQEVNQSGNSTFEPGFVWIKTRSNAASHALFDQVRGVNKQLRSDSNGAEYTAYSDLLTAFDADGFTLGADATVNNVNVNTYTYAAWQWAADGTSGSSNTDGSITSTVSANTTSGFSVVQYTGNATATQTVGHGLGVTPGMVIIKKTSASGNNWQVWHQNLSATSGKVIELNTTAAEQSSTTIFETAPTSSVFGIGSADPVNASGATFIAYCFAEVAGFSKFGSWSGSGSSDGVFINTNFEVGFLMYKRTNTAESWEMYDNTRGFNVHKFNLRANLSNAEQSDVRVDLLSNGFKARSSNTAINASGSTYIYMAFASRPFRYANAQ